MQKRPCSCSSKNCIKNQQKTKNDPQKNPLNDNIPAKFGEEPDHQFTKIFELVADFKIRETDKLLADKFANIISRSRLQKRRSKLQEEAFLSKVAFEYTFELANGYISLDANDWEKWVNSHPNIKFETPKFCCGMVLLVKDPLFSFSQMIEHIP